MKIIKEIEHYIVQRYTLGYSSEWIDIKETNSGDRQYTLSEMKRLEKENTQKSMVFRVIRRSSQTTIIKDFENK